jgi:hypothetical protein
MSLLKRATPDNLLEEKEKFFSDFSYNPQFVYSEPLSEEELITYGKTEPKYVELAKHIIEKTYFGRNEEDLQMLEGKKLDQEDVTAKINDFLAMHNLEEKLSIIWSHSFVSRTTINAEHIKLRLPIEFRREGLLGMLYHEIGTHALRRVNYEQQPWYRMKKKYGFSSYLVTEEGLASLHSILPKTFKSAHTQALRYLAVEYALDHSFAELWQHLSKYISDHNRLWTICFRQKRGMADTSKPGSFTKDLVYFKGLVDVWQWLSQHNYSLDQIYYGKLALEDVDKAVEMNPNFEPVLPSFYSLDKAKYASNTANIGKENFFDQFGK